MRYNGPFPKIVFRNVIIKNICFTYYKTETIIKSTYTKYEEKIHDWEAFQ